MAAYKDDPDGLSMVGKPLTTEAHSDEDVLAEARERSVIAAQGWRENFDLAEDDVRFTEGLNQWTDGDAAERKGRPMLTLNTVPQFIGQLVGEQRQNRPSIHVHPADDYGAKVEYQIGEGKTTRKVKGASILEGIIRSIEFNSGAEAHYDKAHAHSLDGAFGWLRVGTRYANNRDFDQELFISSVKNRWSVLIDPDIQEPDGHDMAYGFLSTDIPRREFDRRWPDARIGSLSDEAERQAWLYNQDSVRVSEYMTREAETRTLLLFAKDGEPARMEYLDEVKDVLDELQAEGFKVIRERKVVSWCCYWRKITAWSVLEGPIKLPFTSVPLIPVFGRERNLRDGRTLYSSIVRHSKDAKRMENYWLTAATERIGSAPKAQWLVTDEAIEGYQHEWERLNTGNPAFLKYNSGAEKPEKMPGALMPAAEVQMAATMGQMVKSTMGMYDANLMEVGTETSGKALNARQHQVRAATYEFTDNLSWAIRRAGLLLVEAIPKIYDTERVMRLRNEDGSGEWVKVNQVVTDQQTGKEVVINGLGQGEFDVAVQAGPSYATQRQEAADGQAGLIQAAPEIFAPVMADIMAENQDWPQADKAARRIRMQMLQVSPHLLTEAEKQELAEEMGPPPGEQQIDPATGQPIPGAPGGAPPDPAAAMQAQMQEIALKVADSQAQADMAEAEAKMATADATKATAEATKAKAAADMAKAQYDMAMIGQPKPAPQQPNGGSLNV
jgi:hypothetical protein